MDCVFCGIIEGSIPSEIIYKDDQTVAIKDINPKAPVHLLVLPREHIATVADLEPGHEQLVGHLVLVAAELARRQGLDEKGYRLVVNCREAAGQAVFHLHVHVLGGRWLGAMA